MRMPAVIEVAGNRVEVAVTGVSKMRRDGDVVSYEVTVEPWCNSSKVLSYFHEFAAVKD